MEKGDKTNPCGTENDEIAAICGTGRTWLKLEDGRNSLSLVTTIPNIQ